MNRYRKLNQLIKNFHYNDLGLTLFEDHIEHTLKNFPVSQIKINKGRIIYRCRKYDLPLESLFHFESDLSYRTDLENITEFGRCNVPFHSVFYGSIVHLLNHKNKEKSEPQFTENGYLTAIFETSALVDNHNSLKISEGIETYGVGLWEATEDFYLSVMPPNEVHMNESELANELLGIHEKNMDQAQVSSEIREFYRIMGNEFSKSMYDKTNSEYGLSALFSTHLINSVGGIAYASVKTEQKGFNVALAPDLIDTKFKFLRAGVGELWKFGKDMHFRFISSAEWKVSNPLKYSTEGIPEVTIEEMINFYKKKGLDPEYIATVIRKNDLK